MEDAVVVTRDAKEGAIAPGGESHGRRRGKRWILGMLIGMLFLKPLLGAAIGAGSDALSGRSLISGSTISL